MTKKRHQNIPASYLTLLKDNKILLLRRFNTGYEDGKYSMVAGHVEPIETFTQCIIREAEEEAGILLKHEHLQVVHVMHRNSGTADYNERVDVFFIAEKWMCEEMKDFLDFGVRQYRRCLQVLRANFHHRRGGG